MGLARTVLVSLSVMKRTTHTVIRRYESQPFEGICDANEELVRN